MLIAYKVQKIAFWWSIFSKNIYILIIYLFKFCINK